MTSNNQQTVPCLWFQNEAEEAVGFYVNLFDGSRIDKIVVAPPGMPQQGNVLTISFQIKGLQLLALAGRPESISPNDSSSLMIYCEDQHEVDRYWNALLDGGTEIACGWIRDRFGFSWQIIPRKMIELLESGEPEKINRMLQQMMTMVKLDMHRLQQAYDGE